MFDTEVSDAPDGFLVSFEPGGRGVLEPLDGVRVLIKISRNKINLSPIGSNILVDITNSSTKIINENFVDQSVNSSHKIRQNYVQLTAHKS